jgi:phage baseplate assembly protein W
MIIFIGMAVNKTYGINFPFNESKKGFYLSVSETPEEEIRSDLLHLIFTRKGSRYYLPDFGTRIYDFIFEPMDAPTFDTIKAEIRQSVEKYIPNLEINEIKIEPYSREDSSSVGELVVQEESREYEMFDIYRTAGQGVEEYTAKIRIDYTIKSETFGSRDFVVINV